MPGVQFDLETQSDSPAIVSQLSLATRTGGNRGPPHWVANVEGVPCELVQVSSVLVPEQDVAGQVAPESTGSMGHAW